MNYHWANLKSGLYRITGLNLFNSKELDVAMDSNEEPDQSAKDVKEAVADALYDHIKEKYASKAVIPE
jgi:predicted chitinase